MDRRGWALGAAVLVLLAVGVGLAVRHRANRSPGAREQLTHEQMMADPGQAVQDRAVAAVTRMGGSVTRDTRSPQGKPVAGADLHGCKVTDADLKELAGLEWLQTLNLSGTRLTDDGLRELRAFQFLQALDLSNTTITDAGLSSLVGLKMLRQLSLAGTKVTDVGLATVAAIPTLRDLDLAGTAVTNGGVAALKPLTELDNLNLARTGVTGAAPVGTLGIRTVDLTGVPVTVDQYVVLRMSKARPIPEEPVMGIPAPGAPAVTPAREVQLVVRGVQSAVDDKWLAALAADDQLDLLVETPPPGRGKQPDPKTEVRILNLAGSKVTDAGLRDLTGFDGFTALDLSGTAVTDAGLAGLAGRGTLTALTLDGTRVTDAGLKHLRKLKGLRTLSLKKTGVTDAGLKEVGAVATLRRLDLGGTTVTDQGLGELKALDELASLNVAGTRVTVEGADDFKTARPKCEIKR